MSVEKLKENIRKRARSACDVRNYVTQKITDFAKEHPEFSKKEAEMKEMLIMSKNEWVKLDDVLDEIDRFFRDKVVIDKNMLYLV